MKDSEVAVSESSPPLRRALVLSGGGRGAYQLGVWRRLQELNWTPDIVCGTSIGAINGALIGSGWDADQLQQLWGQLHEKKVFNISACRQPDSGRIRGREEADLRHDLVKLSAFLFNTAELLMTTVRCTVHCVTLHCLLLRQYFHRPMQDAPIQKISMTKLARLNEKQRLISNRVAPSRLIRL